MTGCKLGYLLNFGEALMKNGITRAINGLEEAGSDLAPRRGDTKAENECNEKGTGLADV